MYLSPIVWGGFYGFGAGILWKRDLMGGVKGAATAAGIQAIRQLALTQFELWVQKQLLYKLYQFQGTYAYRILSAGSRISTVATTTAGAAVAGALVGATAGSLGAMALEEAGLISEDQEADALGFYTGGIRGDKPNYWDTDANESGYFNVVKNVSTIWNYYF